MSGHSLWCALSIKLIIVVSRNSDVINGYLNWLTKKKQFHYDRWEAKEDYVWINYEKIKRSSILGMNERKHTQYLLLPD